MNADIKIYELGNVRYGYNGSRWQFQSGMFSLVLACPGGRKTAAKVAAVINSSIKRTKTYVEPLDNLARWNINNIVNPH